MNATAEAYVLDHYLAFFPGHPVFTCVTTHALYNLMVKASFAGLVVKHGHNVAHLLVSAIRIVKLDVRQKNEEFAKAAK